MKLLLSRLKAIFKNAHREKNLQIKVLGFWKVWIWTFEWLVNQTNSLYEVLKLNEFFERLKQLLEKLLSLWQVNLVLPILFFLALASDRTVLYKNVPFKFLVSSTKTWYSNFSKTVFVFENIAFKVKALKTYTNSIDLLLY